MSSARTETCCLFVWSIGTPRLDRLSGDPCCSMPRASGPLLSGDFVRDFPGERPLLRSYTSRVTALSFSFHFLPQSEPSISKLLLVTETIPQNRRRRYRRSEAVISGCALLHSPPSDDAAVRAFQSGETRSRQRSRLTRTVVADPSVHPVSSNLERHSGLLGERRKGAGFIS